MTQYQGQQIGGISLVRIIGSGGCGDVWLGLDGVGSPVAIKVVDTRLLRGQAADREQRAMRLMRDTVGEHPNLVQLHHIGIENGVFFYTMHLADPQDASYPAPQAEYRPITLESVISAKVVISIDDASRICLDLLDGLEHLHHHGVAHRDIKPANVLLIRGRWHLADFGVASTDISQVTTVGTVGYLAPNGNSLFSNDLYALGKILYCLVTGNQISDFPSIADPVNKAEDRPRLGRIIRVINTACHHDSSKRFVSCAQFRERLQVASRPTQSRRRYKQLALGVAAGAAIGTTGMALMFQREPPLGPGSIIRMTTVEDPQTTKRGGFDLAATVIRDRVWEKSEGGNGHRYLSFLVTPDVDCWGYLDAEKIAQQLGGYLVSINTAEENAWLYGNIVSDRRIWRSYARLAAARIAVGTHASDPSMPTPELSEEAKLYLEKHSNYYEWQKVVSPERPYLPGANGPLIGLQQSNRRFRWADESDMVYQSWLANHPYLVGHDIVAFGYANEDSEAMTPLWARQNHSNPMLENDPNRFVSFIVEIPIK